jgi:hypothetical protein
MKIWTCKIGYAAPESVPSGADVPMRNVVSYAFKNVTGHDNSFLFSGWGGTLTESELAVVENLEPAPDSAASFHFHLRMNDRLLQKRLEGARGWDQCPKSVLLDRLDLCLQEQRAWVRNNRYINPQLAIDIANYSAFLLARD